MSEINVKIIKCDSCGETIEGRLDDGDYRNYCGVKSRDIEHIKLDFCNSCWEYAVERSKNKEELFKLIEKENDWIICDFEYINWDYDENENWLRS
jgi:hypothetical protein